MRNFRELREKMSPESRARSEARAQAMLHECEICHGEKGGEPGNENIVDGKVMCDYCHAEYIKERS